MKNIEMVRSNERLRRASTIIGNGGLALLIAAISRWFGTRLDLTAAIWLCAAAAIILVAVQLNELLEPEDAL